ncbi:MAG: hypothetical protein JWP01_1857 [Myxococcales bacterium]|nr:hypothetical protein [Myxococcales bacterium]
MFVVRHCRSAGLAVVAAVFLMGLSSVAHAQGAWVGEPKTLSVDLSYQYVPSSAVVVSPDIEVADRPTRNHVFTLGAKYVPIEKLAIEGALPLAMLKYAGTTAHMPPGAWDDGNYHTTLTDLRVGARYQLLEEAVALSPHLAVSIPLMDYEVIGFATGGRHLKQLHIGASIGRTLDPWVPNMYLMGSYELSLAEHYDATPVTEDIGQARSDLEAQIGYLFLDGALSFNLAGSWRIQHGGIGFEDFSTPGFSQDLILNHDPLLDEEFVFLGGGASYSVTETVAVSAVVRFFVRGHNTRDQNLFGLNVSWDVF